MAAGESKTVHFTLKEDALGFYNNQGEYIVEPGEFDVMVGGSSVDGLKDSFILGSDFGTN
jgi:beta-glucosidase